MIGNLIDMTQSMNTIDTSSTVERIKQQIAHHDLLLYMKGTPLFPQCGFSGQVVHILKLCKAKFAYVNILENPDIRQILPQVANWPTFPQLYLKGELLGGCDIVTALFEQGELQKQLTDAGVLGEAMESYEAAE
jgi:monothiol glutaredoxin